MAYETGTATDVTDLLSKLRTFALANGWSENFFGARTTGAGNALQINKGGMYVTFTTDTGAGSSGDPGPYIGGRAHDTYNAGNGTELQANQSGFVLCNAMTGPFSAYHFISNAEQGSEYLYAIVETTAGHFKHFGTGVFVKIGAITSGQFFYASNWLYGMTFIDTPTASGHAVPFDNSEAQNSRNRRSLNVRVDAESIAWRWMEPGTLTSNRGMLGGVRKAQDGGASVMMATAASALTGRNVIWPCFMAAERTGGLFNPIGYPPGIRWASLTYLEPNDVLTIGSDQWKVFPVMRKNGGVGQPNSGIYGYAYKVN